MVNVIIVGGRRIALRLIDLLKKRIDYRITLIDLDKQLLQKASKIDSNLKTVLGDPTNKDVLEKANISDASIIIIATEVDEINLLIGVIVQEYNIEKVIATISNPANMMMFKKIGLTEVVSPELTACVDIENLIIKPNVAELSMTGRGDCELIDLTIKSKKVIGKTIGEIGPSKDFKIIMYHKGDDILIAQDNIILEKEDKVTVLVKRKHVKKARKLFTKSHFF